VALRRRCIVEGCPEFTTGTRCAEHERRRVAARGSREERGYGTDHRAARRALERTLPAPCGYCGGTIYPGERWVAAHVVDGDPESPRMVAHPRCNERAKVRV
jgi:hypothetical protein